MSWREAQLPLALAAMLAAGTALFAGCRHGRGETVPTQPFRDESEPGGDFEYSEGAVPAGASGDKTESSASAEESTIEIEIEEGADDDADGAASDDASGDAKSDDSDDDGDGESGDDGGATDGVTGRPGEGDQGDQGEGHGDGA